MSLQNNKPVVTPYNFSCCTSKCFTILNRSQVLGNYVVEESL